MAKMTEQEADALDELLTATTPTLNPCVQGVFAPKRDLMIVLDEFSSKYLMSKMLSTKRAPAELVSDMIRKDMSLV